VARRKTSRVVDGFTTMKAAQRAVTAPGRGKKKPTKAKKKTDAKKPSAVPTKTADRKIPANGSTARIGHTAQPTKHDVVCYECEYAFLLTGQLRDTYCPKCRSTLSARELKIEGKWSGTTKTIGVVKITATGAVVGGSITANGLELAGKIEGGKVKLVGRLDICPGAELDQSCIDAQAMTVREGAELNLIRKLKCRDLEVKGEMKANVTLSGCLTVRSGGYFRGSMQGYRIVVEEGGGLKAELTITPPDGKRDK
jgi:cytoskeletal protein CcmA (bactofilin family)